MRDLFPVVVHTLLWRRGAVVLLRRPNTGYLDGWYALPGGHLQRGEGIIECAVREIREETGIEVDASQLRAAAVMPYLSGEHQGIDFIMLCDDFTGEPTLAEPRPGRRDRLLARRCAAAQHRSVPAAGAGARREPGLVPGIPGLEAVSMLRGWRLGLAITLGLGVAGSLPLLVAYFGDYELNSLYRSFVGLWVNAVVIGYIVGWPLFPMLAADVEQLTPAMEPRIARSRVRS